MIKTSVLGAAGLVLALGSVGCSNRTQPTVTPVPPTGPASQPAGAFALVLTQPALRPAASATNPCAAPLSQSATGGTTLYQLPTVATLIDVSGDSVLAQATLGFGTLTSGISASTNLVYALNCDGTISTIPLVQGLQTNNIATTTLFSSAQSGQTTAAQATVQANIAVQNNALYTVNLNRTLTVNGVVFGSVGALTSTATPSVLQEIAVAPAPVTIASAPTSQRVYVVSQGATGSGASWGVCANPAQVTAPGEVDGIDVSTNSVTSRIPVGICPVFGLTTPDGLRTFVLNRGSGTITVINAQQNTLDTQLNATGTIQIGAGPVYAAYFPQRQLLVTANYDAGSISFINVPLDSLGNDGPGFGQVLATVPVGAFPAALTILADGSRVYTALQGDPTSATATGAIAVVNAVNYTLQNTIAVPGHPRAIASTYNTPIGKVYTVAPDSQFLTILRTDTDTISAQVQVQGCGVDVHTNYQYAGQSNIAGTSVTANTIVNTSDGPGSGAPTISFTPLNPASLCQ